MVKDDIAADTSGGQNAVIEARQRALRLQRLRGAAAFIARGRSRDLNHAIRRHIDEGQAR
jgi:hypothetical protein